MTEGIHYLSRDRHITFEELDELAAQALARSLVEDGSMYFVAQKWKARAFELAAEQLTDEEVESGFYLLDRMEEWQIRPTRARK